MLRKMILRAAFLGPPLTVVELLPDGLHVKANLHNGSCCVWYPFLGPPLLSFFPMVST